MMSKAAVLGDKNSFSFVRTVHELKSFFLRRLHDYVAGVVDLTFVTYFSLSSTLALFRSARQVKFIPGLTDVEIVSHKLGCFHL